MLRPDNRMRQATEKGFGHVVFQALPESTGIPGGIDVARGEYARTRREKGRLPSAGNGVLGFTLGAAFAWAFPATFKALYYSHSFAESMRFLPGLAIDTVNLAATAHVFALTGLNALAAIAFKTVVANTAENAVLNGVGHAVDRLRRGSKS